MRCAAAWATCFMSSGEQCTLSLGIREIGSVVVVVVVAVAVAAAAVVVVVVVVVVVRGAVDTSSMELCHLVQHRTA